LKLSNLTRTQWILIIVLIGFIVTNPSKKSLDEYIGHKINPRRVFNGLILSIYEYNGYTYMGVLGNFINLTLPKKKPIVTKKPDDPFAKYGGHALPPLPKGFTRVDDSATLDTVTMMGLPKPPPKVDEYGFRIKYDTIGFTNGLPILRKHNNDPLDILKKR
jgi:hypothetical protein